MPEVADVVQLTTDTITNWLANGTLRGFRLGRQWRVVKDDFIEDLAVRHNTTGAELTDPPFNLSLVLADLGEILSTEQVADTLRMTSTTIVNFLANGSLRGFQLGRGWRIVKGELLQDVARHYNTSTAFSSDSDAGDEPGL